jgi:hypothetical protein
MAEDALQVIEAYEEREAADIARRTRSQKQSAG